MTNLGEVILYLPSQQFLLKFIEGLSYSDSLYSQHLIICSNYNELYVFH